MLIHKVQKFLTTCLNLPLTFFLSFHSFVNIHKFLFPVWLLCSQEKSDNISSEVVFTVKAAKLNKKMVAFRLFLLVLYFTFGLIMFGGHARYHHHHKKHKHSHHASQISMPPCIPPEASAPSPDENLNNYTSTHDVRMFGAVGDGETDDTEAFKTAWDSACQTDSGVLLVPYGYTFMIQSTIFTGPCQSGFVFQVTLFYPVSLKILISNFMCKS